MNLSENDWKIPVYGKETVMEYNKKHKSAQDGKKNSQHPAKNPNRDKYNAPKPTREVSDRELEEMEDSGQIRSRDR